jgi:hypothetical protein
MGRSTLGDFQSWNLDAAVGAMVAKLLGCAGPPYRVGTFGRPVK